MPIAALLLSLLSTAAAQQDPAAEGDVIAQIQVAAPPSAVFDYLMDLDHHAKLSPEDCTKKWQLGEKTAGVGASTKLVYIAPPVWRRSLTAVLIEADERRITLDHPGNRGFVTTFDFDQAAPEGTTDLTMHTWVNPPPKPFRGVYFKWVQPHWRDCQERFLTNLAAEVGQ